MLLTVAILVLATGVRAVAQQLSWAKAAKSSIDTNLSDYGASSIDRVTATSDGGTLVAGAFSGAVTFGAGEPNEVTLQSEYDWLSPGYLHPDHYLAKYNASGTLAWIRTIATDWPGDTTWVHVLAPYYGNYAGINDLVEISGLSQSSDGSIVLVGSTVAPIIFAPATASAVRVSPVWGPSTNSVVFLAKYDSFGSLVWARGDGNGAGTCFCTASAVLASGDIAAYGTAASGTAFGVGDPTETTLTTSWQGAYLAHYDSNGIFIGVSPIDTGHSLPSDYTTAADMVLLPDNTLAVSGQGYGDGYGYGYIMRLGVTGNVHWYDEMASVGFSSLAARSDGSVLATGWQPSAGNQPFLKCYDSNGMLAWTANWDMSTLMQASTLLPVICDANGTTYLAGDALGAGSITFGAGTPGEVALSGFQSAAHIGSYVATFSNSGEILSARGLPVSLPITEGFHTRLGSIAVTPSGSVCLGASQLMSDPVTIGVGGPVTVSLPATPGIGQFVSFPSEAVLISLRGTSTGLSAITESDGTNQVTVAPTNAIEAGNSDISLTFTRVTGAGTTNAVVTSGPPPQQLPPNFNVAGQQQWYEITTTATYTAPITIQIKYDENGIADESMLRLMHFENGAWVDVTISVDTALNIITGQTSSLSPFAIVVPPPVTISAAPTVVSAYGGTTNLSIVTDGSTPMVSTTAGILISDPMDQGDGHHFTVTLQGAPYAAEAVVTATAGGITANITVKFVPIDPAQSTITLDPATTSLGGVVTVRASLRDGNGNPVVTLLPTTLGTTLGTFQGSVTYLGNGVYQQTLLADFVGTAQVTATVDGLPLAETGALTAIDPSTFGAVFGLDANANPYPYATIQEAVNRTTADHLVHIFVSPGNYRETIKVKEATGLTIEALSSTGPVTVRGFRLVRCTNVELRGFTVDAHRGESPGIHLAGDHVGNSGIMIVSCLVTGSREEDDKPGILFAEGTGQVTVAGCSILDGRGNGIEAEEGGGPFLITQCTITHNGRNGIELDKEAVATITGCTITDCGSDGKQKYGYAILRERGHSFHAEWVTLVGNTFANNRGRVIIGKSDADLGNYDQMIDPTDHQVPY